MIFNYGVWSKHIMFLLLASSFLPAQKRESITSTQYEAMYEELSKLTTDPEAVAKVENLRLIRDVGVFDLREGKLYLCKPIAGRVMSAVFIGNGTFNFRPPTEIEKDQVYRFFEKDSIHEKIRSLVVFFADSTLEELRSNLVFSAERVNDDANDEIKESIGFLGDPEKKEIEYSIMKTILDKRSNELFYAHINASSEPLFFLCDPFATEEISMMRRRKDDRHGKHRREVVSQFHRRSDYELSLDEQNSRHESLKIDSYKVVSTISEGSKVFGSVLNFSATAKVAFTSLFGGQQWVMFYLSEDLQVDSVLSEAGVRVKFFKGKKGDRIWIECGESLGEGDQRTYTFHYRGDIIGDAGYDRFLIKESIFWIPRHGRRKAMFDLTFKTKIQVCERR
ncbi:MAG: hypothetical protein HYY49_13110 [Ignavibacteriales bacterium]|nr:hypothetical protein [Ignavibacteriales bacterium]